MAVFLVFQLEIILLRAVPISEALRAGATGIGEITYTKQVGPFLDRLVLGHAVSFMISPRDPGSPT